MSADPDRPLLRRLARGVYPAFLPAGEAPCGGAERYLEDLWRSAPWFVALGHTVLVALVWVLPPFLAGRARLFPSLPRDEQERMLRRMLASPSYPLRVAGAVCKGAALTATLRDPDARARLLGGRAS